MVIKYTPQVKEMAAKIEETANKMEQEGFELVSCSIIPSSKGILVFKNGEPSTGQGRTMNNRKARTA